MCLPSGSTTQRCLDGRISRSCRDGGHGPGASATATARGSRAPAAALDGVAGSDVGGCCVQRHPQRVGVVLRDNGAGRADQGSWREQTSKADGADVPNRRLNPAPLTNIYGAEELAAPPDLLWSLGASTPIGGRVLLSAMWGQRSSGRSTRNCGVTSTRGCKRWAPPRRAGTPSGSTRLPQRAGHKPGYAWLHRRGRRWVRPT
jgi:hypothetical protein